MKINTIINLLTIALAIVVLSRIALFLVDFDTYMTDNDMAVMKTLVYTVGWASMFYFFKKLNLTTTNIYKLQEMKTISLVAAILCLIRFAMVLYTQLPAMLGNLPTLVFMSFELTTWLLLSIFFFVFYQWKKKAEAEAEKDVEI